MNGPCLAALAWRSQIYAENKALLNFLCLRFLFTPVT